MPWFPQRETEKGEKWEHQPEGRAVLHLAAYESYACGEELRCSKEGLCTMEDAQSATSFGGKLGNAAFTGKIMAGSETQKLE